MMTLTNRERFRRTMEFKPVDRVPFYELGVWGQTRKRWEKEGMPIDAVYFNNNKWFEGEPFFKIDRRAFVDINVGPVPPFEEVTFEETERYVVYRDSRGILRKALKEGESYGTRPSMDQYLDWPVKDEESFISLKKRFDPNSPTRYPFWWEEKVRLWKNRDYPLCLLENATIGLYSRLREWMGTEATCYMFYDNPKLVHEILDFVADFLIEVTERATNELDIDYFNFFEDFAYKTGPLISPNIFREFFMPRYKRIIEHFRRKGIKYFWLDSDGNTEPLLPLLIECGITCHWPLEVAAGMDPVKLRKKYGKDLVLAGGIDKRVLAKDKQAIREELLGKLPFLLETGGYIPHLDHTVPPDIPYENFLYYLELKYAIAEGREKLP